MTINITYDELTDITDAAGLDGDSIRTAYCGRGMVGYAGEPSRTCLGITGDVADFAQFVVELTRRECEAAQDGTELDWSASEIVEHLRTDGMGRGEIFYFPGVTVTEVPAHAS